MPWGRTWVILAIGRGVSSSPVYWELLKKIFPLSLKEIFFSGLFLFDLDIEV